MITGAQVARVKNIGNDRLFLLPREHGAVIVFSLASIGSLLLCRAHLPAMVLAELILWSMILSLHRAKQLLLITVLGSIMLQLFLGTALASWLWVVWAGSRVARSTSFKTGMWWKEGLGLAGSALAPLVVSYMLVGNLPVHLLVACVFVAATLTGAALIRAIHRETHVTPIPAFLLSIVLWICLAAVQPLVVVASLMPFVAQSLWLVSPYKPSFKRLGQVQCLTLLWVAIVLALFLPS